jgi:geranylgeranyl reductase family protein
MKQYKVCIVGAGPAGSIAALFLAKSGINCILIDKARFPRDKICGDGISGWVVTVLNELDKDLLIRLAEQPFMLHSHGIRIVAPNSKHLDLPFLDDKSFGENIPPGFVAQRIHFDNFLIEEVKKRPEIKLIEDTEITNFNYENGGILLSNKDTRIHSNIVIFANGANSVFMKKPGGIIKDKKNTMTGVRAYYSGVTGFHKQNYVELHFIKGLLPGYFWIFPLAEGLANVGVGLDQSKISKRKLNLKTIMLNYIDNIPYLKERFANARLESKIEAYGLPLWDKRRKISGDNFMLAGDVASLIDPVTGEGIGHAAISGMYAAKQAKRSLEINDFSAGFMQQYDKSIYDKIGNELNISSKIPRFIKYSWLFNGVINKAVKSKTLQNRLIQAVTDLEVRKRLKQPSLYLKILLGK